MLIYPEPDNVSSFVRSFRDYDFALDSGVLGAAFSDLMKLVRDAILFSGKGASKREFLKALRGRFRRGFCARMILAMHCIEGSPGGCYTTEKVVEEVAEELPFHEELAIIISDPKHYVRLRSLLRRMRAGLYAFPVGSRYHGLAKFYASLLERAIDPLSPADIDNMLDAISVKVVHNVPIDKDLQANPDLSEADKEVGSLALSRGMVLVTAENELAKAVHAKGGIAMRI